MQKLYIKIAIAIWGVMFLSALIAVVVLRIGPEFIPDSMVRPPGPIETLGEMIEAGSVQTRGEGEEAFIDWFRGNPLVSRHLNVKVTRGGSEVVYESPAGEDFKATPLTLPMPSVTVTRAEGEYEVSFLPVFTSRFGPSTPVQRTIARAAFQPELIWLLLLSAIPVSIGLSMLIARYLVSPLRSFERAGARLAAGDLQVRVAAELGNRGDEIAAFASNFDHMAGKIEHLVEAHRRLLRDVSHELRTPLSRVLAAASLARKAAGEVATEEFDRIEREVDLLNGMIRRLLTYVQLESGEARIDMEEIQLDRLLADVVDRSRIEPAAEERRISLRSDVPCVVSGDRQLLTSGIENVLRNALHHTPKGQPVDIRLKRGDDLCVLTIRDHGPGVPEGELRHLFKPFYQTDVARAPQFGGYGIGLAIVQQAVARHNGTVVAENAAGGGLQVSIELPLRL